jgi:hypothetical protein
MDWGTVLVSATSSLGLSIATAAWLSRTLIAHRLGRERDAYKEEVAGEVKQRVDLLLGARAAEREYEFEARKRLYAALGPLRCQLIVACRDLTSRLSAYSLGTRYGLDLRYYYGRSTLFRILRPIAIAELIERQIYFEDFSVDRDAVSLFRFKEAAYSALSGKALVGDHPRVNWDYQTEHVFYDQLAKVAEAVIVSDGTRVMRFTEFDRAVDEDTFVHTLQPMPALFGDMTPRSKPILWLRLVGFGALCAHVLDTQGRGIGFPPVDYPVRDMLLVSNDEYLLERLDEFEARCWNLARVPFAGDRA